MWRRRSCRAMRLAARANDARWFRPMGRCSMQLRYSQHDRTEFARLLTWCALASSPLFGDRHTYVFYEATAPQGQNLARRSA